MKRVGIDSAAIALVMLVAFSGPALAQTTGSMNGTVVDNSGGVLPGVTVTATSPVLMGSQAAATNEQGQYRFPSLTPGVYQLQFELSGFSTLLRQGIQVNVGFSSTVNVQLAVASLSETVTVSGESPVVDAQNTNIQNNFTSEMMKSIPNSRDVWALISVAPGTTMSRFDVGGSTAGTQTGYTSFGTSGQVRMQLDGVNTTEGTGGAAFYYDYGSFAEVQLGTDSNDASMPTPGVVLNSVVKSGGNEVKGDLYADIETEKLQGKNVDDELRRLGVGEGTRITTYYDPNLNIGGPIKKDKFWYFTSLREQKIGTTVTGYPVEKPSNFESVTRMDYFSYKLTYQLNNNNKISHYMANRNKVQPYRNASSTTYSDAPYYQQSNSWVANISWTSIVSPRFFHDLRVGIWGYNWPNYPYGVNGVLKEDIRNKMTDQTTGNTAGGAQADLTDRRRVQLDWFGTLFRDNWAGGNHSIKFGYGFEMETAMNGNWGYKDSLSLTYRSATGAPDFTTPYRVTLQNAPNYSKNVLFHQGAYVQDQFIIGQHVTINAGVRWDYYSVSYPDEDVREAPFRNFFYGGAALPNGYSIPASYPTFSIPGRSGIIKYPFSIVPRLGLSWNVFGNGKTVVKANWGRYYSNPGAQSAVNPAQNMTYTFGWNDVNADKKFTLGELGSFVSNTGGVRTTIDPNITDPYTDDMSVWFERELVPNFSSRIGFVYKRSMHDFQSIEKALLGSLYTGTIQVFDPGPDGLTGTPDDKGNATLYDVPAGVTIPASVTQYSTPEDNNDYYKNVDITFNKRMSNKWSLMTSFTYTWTKDLAYGHAQNPNEARQNVQNTTLWAFKANGTYRAPWGIVIAPVLRHQGGAPLARVVTANLRTGTFNYNAELIGAYRQDNVTIFDMRFEKRFELPRSREISAFVDAFNITNSHAAQAQDNVVGRRTTVVDGQTVDYQRFLRPTIIIAPRVYRFGVKFSF